MKSQYMRKLHAKNFAKHLRSKNKYKNISIIKTRLHNVKGKPFGYTVYYYSK